MRKRTRIRQILAQEKIDTHLFIEKIKAEGKTALNSAKCYSGSTILHPERTGGGKPSIDREIERYFHPTRRY